MTQKTVLFTPAGSGMAITGIKALIEHDIRIVSTDIDPLSPGLHIADKGYIVPRFDEKGYFNSIKRIVQKEEISIIIPALDTILLDFAEKKEEFEELGVKVMISPPETIEITQDKWKTYQALSEDLPFPESWVEKPDSRFPLFIKPRQGSGSEDAHKIENERELEFYLSKIEKPIIQEFLPGKEYTVDCISDDAGEIVGCVQRERLETKAGISTKVKVRENPKLEEMADKLAKKLEFIGPFFFQAKEDKEGEPRITEVGSRIAGTMCPGFIKPNLHYLGVQQLLGKTIPVPEIQRTCMARYWNELYIETDDIDKVV